MDLTSRIYDGERLVASPGVEEARETTLRTQLAPAVDPFAAAHARLCAEKPRTQEAA